MQQNHILKNLRLASIKVQIKFPILSAVSPVTPPLPSYYFISFETDTTSPLIAYYHPHIIITILCSYFPSLIIIALYQVCPNLSNCFYLNIFFIHYLCALSTYICRNRNSEKLSNCKQFCFWLIIDIQK